MDVNLNKLQEMVKDGEIWRATVLGATERHDRVTITYVK